MFFIVIIIFLGYYGIKLFLHGVEVNANGYMKRRGYKPHRKRKF